MIMHKNCIYAESQASFMNTTDTINALIIEILAREAIVDQQVLLERIRSQGVEITQSTLSRRLKKLQVVKRDGCYQLMDAARAGSMIALERIELAPPVFLVIHTLPGYANAVAVQLDRQVPAKQRTISNGDFSELLGTIAGDDTLLVIAKEGTSLELLRQKFEDFFAR